MISISLLVALASADRPPGRVTVEFRVRVPAGTPRDAKVYLAGSLPELGRWKADGLPLRRGDDERYRAEVALPGGETLEYKVTLGSWRAAEKGPGGAERPNRRLVADRDRFVEVEVAAWAAADASGPQPTLTGTIRFHRDFASRHLGNARTLAVYLPPGYDADGASRYPVLYLHDGQNIFDAATAAFGVEWRADEAAERLIRAGAIRPPIIVAIANTADRMDEYTVHRDPKLRAGGKGAPYARFVAEEVKPFIDARYRTRPGREHTAVAGSSLGALISLEIARLYPHAFSMCGVISPALGWADERVFADLEGDSSWMRGIRFWVDMGTREGRRPAAELDRTRRLAARLRAAGLVEGKDFHYEEVEGGEHNEAAWAERFERVLVFFFGG